MTSLWDTQIETLNNLVKALRMKNVVISPDAHGGVLVSFYRDDMDEPAAWVTIDAAGNPRTLQEGASR